MKIENLYTSIGYGLHLKSMTTKEFCEVSGCEVPKMKYNNPKLDALDFMRVDAVKLRFRDDLDKFLLQPLKIEMFVNPHAKPGESSIHDHKYVGDTLIYEEAEKKVIFKDFTNEYDVFSDGSRMGVIHNGSCYLVYDNINRYCILDIINPSGLSSYTIPIKTLHDLAEATKGELTLKNVVI